MKIIVYHTSYGCDTGCCGHVIEVDGEQRGEFDFMHPYKQSKREYAEALVRREFGEEHVKDLDWDNCSISDY